MSINSTFVHEFSPQSEWTVWDLVENMGIAYLWQVGTHVIVDITTIVQHKFGYIQNEEYYESVTKNLILGNTFAGYLVPSHLKWSFFWCNNASVSAQRILESAIHEDISSFPIRKTLSSFVKGMLASSIISACLYDSPFEKVFAVLGGALVSYRSASLPRRAGIHP